MRQAHEGEDVQADLLLLRREAERGERAHRAEPRVVHQQVQLGVVHDAFDAAQRLRIREVGGHDLDGDAVGFVQALGKGLQAGTAARDDDHIVAVMGQALRERRADAGRGARDQGLRAGAGPLLLRFGRHGSSSRV